MAKYTIDDVYRIRQESLQSVQGVNEWTDFLSKAAYSYKYNFDEQLVIAAKKPNATAVADFKTWSKRLNSAINKGAEGVPLIRGDKVMYFYDIKDTNSQEQPWQMPQKSNAFENALSKAFNYENLSATDILERECKAKADEAVKNINLSVEFNKNDVSDFIYNSMKYIAQKRCGTEPNFTSSDFEYINMLNSEDLRTLGNEINKGVKDILKVVEKKSYEYKLYAESELEYPEVTDEKANAEPEKTEQKQEQPNNIIGNTPYKYIGKKSYRKLDKDTADIVVSQLQSTNIKYSGRINNDNTVTFTVSKDNLPELEDIIKTSKEQLQAENTFTAEEINTARQTNLVDYLNSRGMQLKRVGTNEYTLPEHDSMRISPDRGFYWNSRGIGGNALDFCVQYMNMDFKTAVSELLDYNGIHKGINQQPVHRAVKETPIQKQESIVPEEKAFNPLPNELDTKTNRAYAYLTKTRGISADIVSDLIAKGQIAQDVKGNVVFKITDNDNNVTGAEIVGTNTEHRFKQTTERGGKGFTVCNTDNPEAVIFFESAVDLLSFQSLNKDTLDKYMFVSMAGLKDVVVENAINEFKEKYSNKPIIMIAADIDEAGKNFEQKMKNKYMSNSAEAVYPVLSSSISTLSALDGDISGCKDWNDVLLKDKEKQLNEETVEPVSTSSQVGTKSEDTEKINTSVSNTDEKRELSFSEQVDKALNNELPFYTSLKVCDTPQILLDVGCQQLPMLYTQQHLRKAIRPIDDREHQHGLTVEQIKKLPELIENSAIVFDSISRNDGIVAVTTEKDTRDNPIVVSIKANGRGRYEIENIDSNFITSVYGRNNFFEHFKRVLEADKLLYIDKEKSQKIFERWGEQYSELTNSLDFNNIIHQSRNIVNEKTEKTPELSENIQTSYNGNTDFTEKSEEISENNISEKIKRIDVTEFNERFNEIYSDLYSNSIDDNKYNSAVELYSEIFEDYLEINDKYKEFTNLRNDIVSSDREAAAFVMTFQEFISERDVEKSKSDLPFKVGDKITYQAGLFDTDNSVWTVEDINEAENRILLSRETGNIIVPIEENDTFLNEVVEYVNSHSQKSNKLEDSIIEKETADVSLQDKTPNYKVGDHVEIDYGDTHYSGTIHYKSDTTVNIKTDNGYSWDYRNMSREYFENALKNDSRNAHLFEKSDISEIEYALKNKHTIYFSDNSKDDELVTDARKAVFKDLCLNYSDNGYVLTANAEKNGKTSKDIVLRTFGDDVESIENYIAENNLAAKGFSYNYEAAKVENFRITEENTDVPQKEKFRNNIEAVKTLKTIESENRTATPEEQKILSKYIGWGGLDSAFDSRKDNWKNEYAQLKELLTDSEYMAARSSTTNAFYTSSDVIKSMYTVLDNLGFKGGKLLEPAMGNGRFFGNLPDNLKDKTHLYGVELDSLTGRIAKQLYPEANIQIKGFEKTAFQSNFFDVAIGNVPFGNYRVNDNDFKGGELIHDYFVKKSLDKVKNGGVVAFVTSKGTLDKQDNSVRKYLAERADLLGAVRLPKGAFSETDVTSDIIFLQKRDSVRDFTKEEIPDWVNLAKDENGIEMNSYFVNNPNMICGEMAEVSGRFGMETICKPVDTDLSELLSVAVANISGKIETQETEISQPISSYTDNTNIVPENYRNYCYAEIDNKIYYRENDDMQEVNLDSKKTERLKGMIAVSEALREVINTQKENYDDSYVKAAQDNLNKVYDDFTAKFGLLNDKVNAAVFKKDDTAPLISSLENIDDKGELISKADIFTKRTIQPYIPVTHVDTSSEALAVSISEKAKVDLEFMSELCNKPQEDIIEDLKGVIFENPLTKQYETADEYLSGNVREKLAIAEEYAKIDSKYAVNVGSLKDVQPEDLKPSEISAQLGSAWIPTKYYEQFIYELLDTPRRCQSQNIYFNDDSPFLSGNGRYSNNRTIMVDYDITTATYGISNKSSYAADADNVKANKTYGTDRINAYKIIEESLNLKSVKIFDYYKEDGKTKAVLNQNETVLAQEKQEQIKQKFKEWIFDDYERTQDLCRIYNEKFNSTRLREYDGKHLTFGGINPEIKLRKHQKDAIAHTIYGGNTLLAHSVGAGKTFEICASAMESKRLGLCSKSLICVPKHIVNQFAREFLQLYPTANILVPNEKDFSKENREKFCSRIATGNYDAVILSHNQLEKIPLSKERQAAYIQNEIEDITADLEALRNEKEKGFSVKQLETKRKQLQVTLEKLNNDEKRDTTVTFEELGIDKMFIDEAHLFKNKFFSTKIGRNVSGINASSVSQRATDLDMKCQYLDEITGSKGVVFATGTPISNSMTELYTMQSYLQRDTLKRNGLGSFDAWASCFGETQLSLELAPEGKGYQMKNRFSRFFNIPELMSMFKEIADIKTADMLNLPVPEANYHTVATEASEHQAEMVDGLSERADKIRKKEVTSDVDNMLNITNDGRKLALDQRLMNELLPDDENNKVNTCINNVYKIWSDTEEQRSTQMIFCDLSTPHYDGKFNVYDDIKNKLIDKGVPEKEIAFIHDCKNDKDKQKLFTKVRNGEVRVLLGSTSKMGTGTNAQQKLKALHHIDCPYRPSDLEQRNGRIIRQGNENSEVDIYNYVTKGTFDAYLYQLVENKQRFISQIMTSKSPARVAEDIDESVLNYAQIKALASGNPKIKEKMDLDIEVNRLKTIFAGYQEEKRSLQENIAKIYPEEIQKITERIKGLNADIAKAESSKTEEFSQMTVKGNVYTDKKEAGAALIAAARSIRIDQKNVPVGNYRGFEMQSSFDGMKGCYELTLKGELSHKVELGADVYGNLTRLDNLLNKLPESLETARLRLEKKQAQLSAAKKAVILPFPQAAEIKEKEARLTALNKELSIDSLSDDKKEESIENKDHTDKDDRMCI